MRKIRLFRKINRELVRLARRLMPSEIDQLLLLSKHCAKAQSADFSHTRESQHLQSILVKMQINEGYIVDIAASDGVSQSCTLPFFNSADWRGLAVEYDSEKFARLAWAYAKFPHVALSKNKITPLNVVDLLRSYLVPISFELLNLDIDSYDLFVLQSLLEGGFRPRVMSVEINEKIPPPLYFTVLFDDEHSWSGDHFFGCSAVAVAELAKSYGYILESIHYNNAVFVIAEDAENFNIPDQDVSVAYQQGYASRPDRAKMFPWNVDVDGALSMTAPDAEAFFAHYFRSYVGRFELRV